MTSVSIEPSDHGEPSVHNVRSLTRIASAVLALRRSRGLTQAELATRARVSRQWVVALEAGQNDRLEVGRLLQVLDALGVMLQIRDDDHGVETVDG